MGLYCNNYNITLVYNALYLFICYIWVLKKMWIVQEDVTYKPDFLCQLHRRSGLHVLWYSSPWDSIFFYSKEQHISEVG